MNEWALVFYPIVMAAAVGLAVPAVNFYFVLFTLGLGFFVYVALGVFALLGPLVLLVHSWLARIFSIGSRLPEVSTTVHLWLWALILHAGASYGRSRWGEVASGMGGKNSSYLDQFFGPVGFIWGALKLDEA
jgi:hypothetical protein